MISTTALALMTIIALPLVLLSLHKQYLWFKAYYELWPAIQNCYSDEFRHLSTANWWSSNILFFGEFANYLIARRYREIQVPSLNELADPIAKGVEFHYRSQFWTEPYRYFAIWIDGGILFYELLRNTP
ncbi:MAG: hypothetical protein ACJA1I_002692 [Zhongshania marina]|jgi:hypothetical protein